MTMAVLNVVKKMTVEEFSLCLKVMRDMKW